MKRILSFLFVIFLCFAIIPVVKAENNLLVMKVYNYKTSDDIREEELVAFRFLGDKGLFEQVTMELGGYLSHNGKVIFSYRFDPELKKEVYSLAEDVSYKDNGEYIFTTEDKEIINNNENYSLLRNYDGVRIIIQEECNENEICIIDTRVDDSTDNIIINSDPVIDGLTVSFDVSLKQVNDFVKYKVTIQNKTSEEYKLNVKDFNKSEYIKYTYTFDDETSIIKADSDKIIYVTIKYEKQIPSELLIEGFEEENKVIFTTLDDVISNPKTGQLNLMVILSIGVVLMAACYLFVDKKSTKYTLSILLLTALIPLSIKALTELTITVNTKVEVHNTNIIMSRYVDPTPGESVSMSKGPILQKMNSEDSLNDDKFKFWEHAGSIWSVTFSNKIVELHTYEYKYDVSEEQDNSIIAYLVKNTNDNSLYDLYIMANGIIYANPNSSNMFADFMNLKEIKGLEYFDTSKATDMSSMFEGCTSLETLDLSYFDTSSVKYMITMFAYCRNLKTIYASSLFKTDKVTTSTSMFLNCSKLVGGVGTSFSNQHLDATYAKIDTAYSPGYFTKVEKQQLNNLSGLSIRSISYNSISVTVVVDAILESDSQDDNLNYQFLITGARTCPTSEYFTTSNRTYNSTISDMTGVSAFLICARTINKEGTKVGDIVSTSFTPQYAMLDTGTTVNAKIKSLANGSDKTYTFSDQLITAIKKSNSLPNGFVPNSNNTISLTNSPVPVYIYWDSDNTTIYYYTTANYILLNNNSAYLFKSFKNAEIIETDTFDTTKVTSMMGMFSGDNKLKSLDLSNFNTKNVVSMSYMFMDCYELESLNIRSFDTRKVSNMSYMFWWCKKLQIIDVSSFDTSYVYSMSQMFSQCESLITIYVSQWDISKVTESTGMFYGSPNIVGGNGTTYDSNHTGLDYARVDTPETPGYFTPPLID